MTIFIDAQSVSDLTSYTGLVECVGRWLERPDLTDDTPDFIRLAEARFRRVLVMPDMEKQISIAGTGAALPVDFDSLRTFSLQGTHPRPIEALAPADFYALPTTVTGCPSRFCIVNGQILTWPAPDQSYTALMTYRASLPSLSVSNQSNWLLAQHPDAYLYGTLMQAEFYGWNDDRLPLIKTALDEVLSEMITAGNRKRYGGGPLVMRPAVRERV